MQIVVAFTLEEIEGSAEKLGIKLRPNDGHDIRQTAGALIGRKLEQLGLEMLDSCVVAYAVMSGLPIEKPVDEALMNTIRQVEEEEKKINQAGGN